MRASIPPALEPQARRSRRRKNGQILVIFAGALIALIGIVAVVVDVSWYWASSLRVQRAADAAALAGAVYLPSDTTSAYLYARDEATKNGYTAGGGTTITPIQDTANGGTDPRQLDVTISTPVQTFFARVLGINSFNATRTAKAIYVQPVPMGSPLAYYGVGCLDTHSGVATAPDSTGEPACTTAGNSNGLSGVPDATAGSNLTGAGAPNQLSSQGAWGVVFTRGGDSRNGDAFSTAKVSSGGSWVPNAGPAGGGFDPYGGYDPAGYNYGIDIPGGGGAVSVFDPIFCGMPTLGSGRAGTGDEWTGAAPGASNPGPVTTYYNLWQVVIPGLYSADKLVYSSGSLFENGLNNDGVSYVDESAGHGSGAPQYASNGTSIKHCDQVGDPAYPYHLKWWTLPTGALAAGTYRLQITTTQVQLPPLGQAGFGGGNQPTGSQPSDNVGAANRWSLEATGGGAIHIFGLGRMATYTNTQSGTQALYLAQIDRPSGAGKTIEIDLYDPGDVGGGAWLQFLDPDGNVYTPATFSYSSVDKSNGSAGPSGSGVTCIETNSPGSAPAFGLPAGCPAVFDGSGSHFDAHWVKILISLPSGYGLGGLTPPGSPAPGWWKIQYTVGGGNDTTTWQVNILGNPVHLVVP
jgi:Flp pilus assembly protein TadG